MTEQFRSGCLICGEELVYAQKTELLSCFYCGAQQETDVHCINDHFVCDRCHSLQANDLIEQYCTTTQLNNPIKLATILMRNPAINMHGPEHHFLVPAVLLAAFYNLEDARDRGGMQVIPSEKIASIQRARKRAEVVRGGFCGYYGACGAGVGTGIFLSVLTGATPLSGMEWGMCNRITAESLMNIADHGGPRCCKRDTYLALLTTGSFVKQHFAIDFHLAEDIRCGFHELNKECLYSDCPFYKDTGEKIKQR
jgi:hypothetical protein